MKLIRDKYINIINSSELSKCKDNVERLSRLDEKLDEESLELRDSNFEDVNEFADVLEVIYAIAEIKGISPEDIESARIKKLNDKGGFNSGLLLK